MDLKGSLVDTKLRIYPSEKLLVFLKTIIDDNAPTNILILARGKDVEIKNTNEIDYKINVHLTDTDFETISKIKKDIQSLENKKPEKTGSEDKPENEGHTSETDKIKELDNTVHNTNKKNSSETNEDSYLTTTDIDWLYDHIQKRKIKGDKDVPFLHALLEGARIEVPENKIIKRNPVLEARCVKLRAQQEARMYRKMTKSVDNVRMKFPEDSISYQLKQVNRQLIAVGQFIISIFAGFLFGFKGIEWMVGNLDFGFKLLLGVICALIIALAEIYFLAKKLNEELNVPETVQLGGPVKFANEHLYGSMPHNKSIEKEHQD